MKPRLPEYLAAVWPHLHHHQRAAILARFLSFQVSNWFDEQRIRGWFFILNSFARLTTPLKPKYHQIGNPRRQRTPYVIVISLASMTATLAASLFAARFDARMLLLIPAYGIYMTLLLGLRARSVALAG